MARFGPQFRFLTHCGVNYTILNLSSIINNYAYIAIKSNFNSLSAVFGVKIESKILGNFHVCDTPGDSCLAIPGYI